MIFMTDCSFSIGGARLMHGPFSKILGGRAPPAPRIDAPESEPVVYCVSPHIIVD